MTRPPRPARIGALGLLGLAIVVVVGLGLGAVLVTGYFRRSAEGVLRDYTTLAADRLAQAIEIRLAQSLYPILAAERSNLERSGWQPTDEVLAAARSAGVPPAAGVLGVFARPAAGPVVGVPALEAHTAGVLGGTFAEWRQVLGEEYLALRWAVRDSHVAVYNIEGDGPDATSVAYGILIRLDSVTSQIAGAIQTTAILPSHLDPNQSGGAGHRVAVTLGDSPPLVALDQYATLPTTVARPLRAGAGGLVVHVALAERISSRLVHGGPPVGGVWLFWGLLALAVFLLGAAALVWRQEHRLVRLREQFVAGVSHELRTPLAQIRLYADTLALGRVRSDEEADQAHRVIGQETRRLTHLVDNLLLFSRRERNRLTLARQMVDVSALVADIVQEFRPLADAARAKIASTIEPAMEAEVDPDAVRQIVLNLLDNAVKYGGKTPTIHLELRGTRDAVELTLQDGGPGIAREHRRRVWERFWRGPDVVDRGIGGSGIGLAVVSDLVRRHGGVASVDGDSPGGARFTVSLPRRTPEGT